MLSPASLALPAVCRGVLVGPGDKAAWAGGDGDRGDSSTIILSMGVGGKKRPNQASVYFRGRKIGVSKFLEEKCSLYRPFNMALGRGQRFGASL